MKSKCFCDSFVQKRPRELRKQCSKSVQSQSTIITNRIRDFYRQSKSTVSHSSIRHVRPFLNPFNTTRTHWRDSYGLHRKRGSYPLVLHGNHMSIPSRHFFFASLSHLRVFVCQRCVERIDARVVRRSPGFRAGFLSV